jgi:hypothetical protein
MVQYLFSCCTRGGPPRSVGCCMKPCISGMETNAQLVPRLPPKANHSRGDMPAQAVSRQRGTDNQTVHLDACILRCIVFHHSPLLPSQLLSCSHVGIQYWPGSRAHRRSDRTSHAYGRELGSSRVCRNCWPSRGTSRTRHDLVQHFQRF